jgi:predicted AAA+ superfamily ATPase
MIFQLLKYFLENKIFSEKQIFYLNKEELQFDHIKDFNDLKKEFFEWKEKNLVDDKFVIALDEVQEIREWEKFVL